MKTKTDIYTKIILTVIALFLGIIVFKDINFVSKAQASELDLSALKIEQATNEDEMTFFIYENSKIKNPFEATGYRTNECEISYNDIPSHIITSKKVPRYSSTTIKKTD